MTLAAAHWILQQREPLKVTPAKTGYSELCRRAILANHTILSVCAKDFAFRLPGLAHASGSGVRRISLLTQNYHVPRLRVAAKHLGNVVRMPQHEANQRILPETFQEAIQRQDREEALNAGLD